MENIITKLKLAFNASLKPKEIAQLKADIIKLEANLVDAPIVPAAPVAVKTKDGKVLSFEGELKESTAVMIIDETGATTPAVTGDYELEDGTIVSITDGLVTAVKKLEAPKPAEEMAAQLSAHKKEIESDYSIKLSDQKKLFDAKLDELSKIVLSQHKMLDAFINMPFEEIKEGEVKMKSIDEMTEYEFYKYQKAQSRNK